MEDSRRYNELLAIIDRLKKELTEAKAGSSKLKRSFLSGISHELRTPMHAILGFSELLANLDLSKEEKEEYAMYIQECGNSLLSTIDAMIDAALLEQNDLILNHEECNIDDLMDSLNRYASTQKHRQEKFGVAILYSASTDHEAKRLYTDTHRLQQVLIGLINNALKFTPKGIIEFGCHKVENQWIQFFVSDSGNGGLAKAGNLLFDNFDSVEESGFQGRSLAGLGLGMMKGIIEKMGGNIWVEANIFKGSTFMFNLPCNPHVMNKPECSFTPVYHSKGRMPV